MKALSPFMFRSIRVSTLGGFEEALDTFSEKITKISEAIQNLPVYLLWYWNLFHLGTKQTKIEFQKLEARLFLQCSDEVKDFYNLMKSGLSDDASSDLEMITDQVVILLEKALHVNGIKIEFDNGRITGDDRVLDNNKALITVVSRKPHDLSV